MQLQQRKIVKQIWGHLETLWNGLIYFLEVIVPVISLVLIVYALMVQVVFRYVLGTPLTWPFELSIYAFVWTLYLGAAHAARTKEHVKLDVIYTSMPLKAQKLCDIFFNITVIVLFALILRPVWDYLIFSYRIKTVALKLPWTYVFGAFPLFLILTIIHNIGHVIRDIRFVFGRDEIN